MSEKQSDLEAAMAYQLRVIDGELPAHEKPVTEYRFHETRKWRFDFAFPSARIAIECEGGTYSGGRHVRGQGFEDDCEKYNHAVCLGWLVLRLTKKMIEDGEVLRYLTEALIQREAEAWWYARKEKRTARGEP